MTALHLLGIWFAAQIILAPFVGCALRLAAQADENARHEQPQGNGRIRNSGDVETFIHAAADTAVSE